MNIKFSELMNINLKKLNSMLLHKPVATKFFLNPIKTYLLSP